MSVNTNMRVAIAGALTAATLGSGLALAPNASAAVSSTTSTKAYNFSKAQIGDRYVLGATGFSTYDCSGLVWRAYQQAGKSWKRMNAHDQRRYQTVDITSSQARIGDLVFFRKKGSSYYSHVGIYAGSGYMVNAVTGSYWKVRKGLVADGYWNKYYVADYRRVK